MTTIIIHNYFRYLFIIAFLIVPNFISAAGQPKEVITVSTPKFGSDLINVWIHKYAEIHPEVRFQIIDGKKEQADLNFISEITSENQNSYITYVGRYALLPVTTIENPLFEKLSKKRLDKKELKELFFQGDALQKADKNSKSFFYDELTIYSGTSKTSGANAFASFFGYPTSQLRGKRIAGDDAFLLTAINKDHTGVTFNNLTYIFDLKNRKLPNLCLIPLDLKSNTSVKIYRSIAHL